MATIDEASDPDIRNQHRIDFASNVNLTETDKHQGTRPSPHLNAEPKPQREPNLDLTTPTGSFISTSRTRVEPLLRNLVLPIVVVVGIYTLLWSTAAKFATGSSAGSFAPDAASFALINNGTGMVAVTPARQHRSTPILSAMKHGATWVVSSLSASLGYELVPVVPLSHTLQKRHTPEMNGEHVAMASMIPALVLLSGIFAGLTLGYFSVDPTQLHVLSISGTPKQQEYARRIMPVRKNSHLLLTTLILGNMIVNEALPVIMDGVLGGGIVAVVISTALVVIFAEIIPQSVCSRHGLLIGATMAPVVRVMIWLFLPLAWPIAKLLECILGRHHGIIYRRAELRELIKLHAVSADGGGDLDVDTVTMAQGALDLAQKTVRDAMTPIDGVFMLPITAVLDYETLGEVVHSGHSRIPVYQLVDVPAIDLVGQVNVHPDEPTKARPGSCSCSGSQRTHTRPVKKVIGSMLVKSCVLLDPEDATPLASIPINAIPTVPWNEPLTNMLNAFQDGKSHMAIVSRRSRETAEESMSIMTMTTTTTSTGGLKQRLMRKVTRHARSSTSSEGSDDDVELGLSKCGSIFRRKSAGSAALSPSVSASSGTVTSTKSPKSKTPLDPVVTTVVPVAENEKPSSNNTLGLNLNLSDNEQRVPSDAELPPLALEQLLDALDAPLGIITLEDVLEELIGEEIYDEYDTVHSASASTASTYVPRDAVWAARTAQLERERESYHGAVVALPDTNTTIQVPAPAPLPSLEALARRVRGSIPPFAATARPPP